MLVFMVILPIAVVSGALTLSPSLHPHLPQGTWWYRSIKYSTANLLIQTSQVFFHFLSKPRQITVKSEASLSHSSPHSLSPGSQGC